MSPDTKDINRSGIYNRNAREFCPGTVMWETQFSEQLTEHNIKRIGKDLYTTNNFGFTEVNRDRYNMLQLKICSAH